MNDLPKDALPTRVFLSYARGDDEPFVRRLHTDLTKAGFTVWFDRESLLARGLNFHQEIKDAIRTEVDRVVYVGGPKAALSAYVREEWQFALECDHVVVTPILRLGDYEHVPGELSLLHCEDFRDDGNCPAALAKLITSLRQPNPKLGALFAVPSLPPNFLGRPELMRRVRDALLVDLQTTHVITGADARVGMQGMGGIGKSVLAAALARNRQVRESYPDGVVWIAAGQKLTDDDLLKRQRDLARHLGGDDTFASLAQGQGMLRQLLAAKAVLLVLDDVWRAADAQAFDVLGPRCRMLVTTRDKGILDALHGELVPVSLFTEPEALQLLADAVNVAPAALPTETREVARECGLLPLALALCGGMARKRGGDFHSVLERLRRADLEKIADRESINEQHRSIWRAMQASVEMLPDDEQKRFAELSVFAGDQTVPEAAAATLWSHTGDLDDLDTEELLINLAERSLVQLDQQPEADGKVRRRFRLHDLLHDYAVRIAGEPRAVHQKLLDAYRRKCPNGWHSGPNDGYFLQNLRLHLERADRGAEIIDLLVGFDWLVSKIQAHLAWDLLWDVEFAEKMVSPGDKIRLLQEVSTALKQELPHFAGYEPTVGVRLQDFVLQQLRNRIIRNTSGEIDLCHVHLRPTSSSLLLIAPLRRSYYRTFIQTAHERTRAVLNGSLRFLDGGRCFVVANAERTPPCIDVRTGRTERVFECLGRALVCDLSPDGSLIVFGGDMGSGTSDGFLQVFNSYTSQSIAVRKLDTFAYKMIITADATLVVSHVVSPLKTFKLPNLDPAEDWMPFSELGDDFCSALAVNADRRLMATGEGHDQERPCHICLWRTTDRSLLAEWVGPRWQITVLAFASPDSKSLLIGSRDLLRGFCILPLPDAATGGEVWRGTLDNEASVVLKTKETVTAITPIGRTPLIAFSEGAPGAKSDAVAVFNPTASTSKNMSMLSGHPQVAVAMACDPMGNALVTLHAGGEVILWPVDGISEVGTLNRQPIFISHSSDSRCERILSLSNEKILFLTDTRTGKTHAIRKSEFAQDSAVALSPAGDKFVSVWWSQMPMMDYECVGDEKLEKEWWETFASHVPISCFIHGLDSEGRPGKGAGWQVGTGVTVLDIVVSKDGETAAALFQDQVEGRLLFVFPLTGDAEPIAYPASLKVDRLDFSISGSLLLMGAHEREQLSFILPKKRNGDIRFFDAPFAGTTVTSGPCFVGKNSVAVIRDLTTLAMAHLLRNDADVEGLPTGVRAGRSYHHPFPISEICGSPDGKLVAIADTYPSVTLLQLPELSRAAWRPLDQICNNMFFSGDSSRLLVVGNHPDLSGLHYSLMQVCL